MELDVVVMPSAVDELGTAFTGSDVALVRELQELGATSDYLQPESARLAYTERSVGALILTFVVGVASNAGWSALRALLSGKRAVTPVRATIARRTETNGASAWEWYEIEGSGSEVAEAIDMIRSHRSSDAG
jgi:hypothetical protein